MATSERLEFDIDVSASRLMTRVAILENTIHYNDKLLERIEKKLDKLEIKIDRVEYRIYRNFKWFIGFGVPTIIAILTLIFDMYQYVRH